AATLVLTVAGVVSLGGLQMGEDWRRASPVAPFDVTAEPIEPHGPTAPPVVASVQPRENKIDLDLRSGNQLWTADGKRLALTGVGEVTRIYRVPGGWVYGGAAEVRLMRPDGTSRTLIRTGDRWIVSPDGARIAAMIGDALRVGRIDDSSMVVQASAAVPAGTKPVVFAGNGVVVARASSSGYGLLDPARPTAPAWNRDILAVFGRHGSGLAALVRRAGRDAPCLAVLKAVPGLPVSRAGTCGGELTDATEAGLSPNGSWLATSASNGVSLVDLARAASGQPATTRCAVRPSVAPVWAGSTIVTADERGLVRCYPNGRQEVVPPPAGIAAGWQLVPALEPAPAAPATTRPRPTTAT
ncbi:MAG TPA: hypothetical protein VHN18_01985, partial [Micromonosporaceae bacterium]|nr:hypothetical protein [Micromonosporaceae bacterium]